MDTELQAIDTGDTVFHTPSGETWLVALVEGEYLSWCGWPEGRAKLSDCVLVEKASLEEKQDLLNEMASISENDHRRRYARRVLTGVAD